MDNLSGELDLNNVGKSPDTQNRYYTIAEYGTSYCVECQLPQCIFDEDYDWKKPCPIGLENDKQISETKRKRRTRKEVRADQAKAVRDKRNELLSDVAHLLPMAAGEFAKEVGRERSTIYGWVKKGWLIADKPTSGKIRIIGVNIGH